MDRVSIKPPEVISLILLADLRNSSINGKRYILIRCCPQSPQLEVTLSPREREIVRLIAKGLPNKSIAAVLDISPWTVSTHLRRVFVKMGVCSRAEMVAQALKEGLLGSEG